MLYSTAHTCAGESLLVTDDLFPCSCNVDATFVSLASQRELPEGGQRSSGGKSK